MRVEHGVRSVDLVRCVLMAAVMLLVVARAEAGAPGSGAAVQGVVRDAQGVAQMGALVQVMANSTTVATAFTDLHGYYKFANLLPGRYAVRATATLFLPVSKNNLQLRNGRTIVNLTLATFFETATWLPSDRRKPGEAADDWKWTLRSTANRPILRILDDGQEPTGPEGPGRKQTVQARASVQYAGGAFGESGTVTSFAANRESRNGSDVMVQTRVGTAVDPMERGLNADVTAGYQRRVGFGTARTIVRYQSHPELMTGDGQGVQSMAVRSGQKMEMGDLAEIEVGGSMLAVRSVGYAVQAAPFLRLTAHPTGKWMVQYRMASSRDLQGVDNLDAAGEDIPVAYVANGRLRLEQGRHQQVKVARKVGRGAVEVTVYHDALNSLQVAGGASMVSAGIAGGVPALTNAAVVTDGINGTFRGLAGGYSGNGASIELNEALLPGLIGAVEYTMGDALQMTSGSANSVDGALAMLKARPSQSGTVAVQGHVGATRLRMAYRWQPLRSVTEVNPYGDSNGDGYLSFTVRQPLRWGNHLPPGLDAMIDVTNLLAQGYRPFVSADGQTLYFAQAPRTMRAGLAFTF